MVPDPLRSGVPLAELLAASASRDPQAPALVVTADRVAISYGELVGLVDELAGQLVRGGLSSGDRVGLRAYGNAAFVVGLFAASRAGLVVVPVDPALPISTQRARLTAAGARVVLVDDAAGTAPAPPSWPISVRVTAGDGTATVELETAAAPDPTPVTPDGLRPDDAVIMFTGGTTGSPKMVPWTRDNIAGAISGVVAAYRLGPQDATVAVMPLFHGHGLIAALLSTLASGGCVLLPAAGRFSAHTFWDDVRAARASWFTAAPTIHRILLDRAATDYPGPAEAPLRFIRSCSAALDPETARGLQAEFAAPVLSAYGMTEATHQVSSMGLSAHDFADEKAAVRTGLVGRSTGVDIRIVGDGGRMCAPDTVGEVWLRGRTIVRGYLDAAATARSFTDGWLHTGDLGSLSPNGELTLRGRIKEMINRGGEKISPEHVEGVLTSHPEVAEAAVFAVPDRIYGEAVAAVIVPRSATPDFSELAEFCRERLAAFEVPASFTAAAELPHTAKGSLDRRAVAQRFGSRT
ncbi:MAG: fatty acid--CoA ligase family protein [Mycobacterium sp.]|nr:MAG: fatty acid--CoA ligase family protein [Mycobacterium sp.]